MRDINASDFKVGNEIAIISTETYMPINTIITVKYIEYSNNNTVNKTIKTISFNETSLVINYRHISQYVNDLFPYYLLTDEEKFLFKVGGVDALRRQP